MPQLVTSVRFQLLGILLCGVLLPAFIRGGFTYSGLTAGNNLESMGGAALAIFIGYFFYRKLIVFPGTSGDFYIVLSFVSSYLMVFVVYFFLRFDYARSTILISFFMATSWIYVVSVASRLMRPLKLAIIPGGNVDSLMAIPRVRWLKLDRTDEDTRGCMGLVADLRADLPVEWERYIADAALRGLPVFHVKQIRESLTGRVEIEHLSENTLGSLNPNRVYFEIKMVLDLIAAISAAIVLSPLFLVLAFLIKVSSRGPVLFVQKRRGFRGSTFNIYKFRTMYIDENSGVELATPNDESAIAAMRSEAITKSADSRVTMIGRFLRRTRLDELPQIINIIRGEMSWIGPRPEALVLSKWYKSELPFYTYRHIVRPGITGWAQVHQGHVAGVEDVNQKLYYDFYYIKNFSFWIDFVIVLHTIRTLVSGFGWK